MQSVAREFIVGREDVTVNTLFPDTGNKLAVAVGSEFGCRQNWLPDLDSNGLLRVDTKKTLSSFRWDKSMSMRELQEIFHQNRPQTWDTSEKV